MAQRLITTKIILLNLPVYFYHYLQLRTQQGTLYISAHVKGIICPPTIARGTELQSSRSLLSE